MRSRTALTAVCAVVLASLVAAPAQAEYYSTSDPADANRSLTDIRAVRAKHGAANVVVKVRFQDLTRSSAAGLSVFIDTDRGERGAEYVLSSGLNDGTDYVLTTAAGWRGTAERVECDYEATYNWGIRNSVRVRIDRECLQRPSAVRVSVKMADPTDGSTRVVDWSPERRRWSLPIESGLGA
ncbi:hypothetical protein [Nocardioides furvisabuli]|nr:hypothetical protein [Nocardioides furvisabuli]